MQPTPPSRSAWAGPYYAGWLFLLGGLAVAAGACWLVVTLLGCGDASGFLAALRLLVGI